MLVKRFDMVNICAGQANVAVARVRRTLTVPHRLSAISLCIVGYSQQFLHKTSASFFVLRGGENLFNYQSTLSATANDVFNCMSDVLRSVWQLDFTHLGENRGLSQRCDKYLINCYASYICRYECVDRDR